MKLTLDRLCITAGRLCYSCQKKYDNGIVSQIDIDVGDVLLNAAKSKRFLSDITIKRIVETSEKVYIFAKGDKDIDKLNQADDHLQKLFRKKNDKEHVYVSYAKGTKKLLEILLDPVVPVGTSTMMLPPDGIKELKIQIKKKDKDEIPIDASTLSEITSAILGMNCHFAYV